MGNRASMIDLMFPVLTIIVAGFTLAQALFGIVDTKNENENQLPEKNVVESSDARVDNPEIIETDFPYTWMTEDHIRTLDAIAWVESGGNISTNVVGDGGKALGPYQIHQVYWIDAMTHDSTIGGTYSNVVDYEYARKIVLAYWDRYGNRVGYDPISLARMHNAGPRANNPERISLTENYIRKLRENWNDEVLGVDPG